MNAVQQHQRQQRPYRRARRAFTIVELLTVVAIIGVLASIAVWRYGAQKRKAFLSVMKADLHNLALAAEARYASEHTYATVVVPQGSAGVRLTFTGTASSWDASATHSGVPGVSCTMSAGRPEPVCR